MKSSGKAGNRACTLLIACTLLLFGAAHTLSAQTVAPFLQWSFDEKNGDVSHESIQHANGNITGVHQYVPGVTGQGLRLDGETSGVMVPAAGLRAFPSSFTIDAWIAIDAYPWNWAPILDQRMDEKAGLLFGVDSFGHLGLQASVGGSWQFVVSREQLPLKKWIHVAATLSSSQGMTIFIDGKAVRSRPVPGPFLPASDQDLLIGRVRQPMLPAQWLHPKFAVWYSFDGILDTIRVLDGALTAAQVEAEYKKGHPPAGEVLAYPKLPSGPPGAGPFGAYYTTLKFDELWDAPRRVGHDSDVVVRFDDAPIRFVSWQGTNYIPAWVSENGKWYTDEFVETGGLPGCPGGEDCEPMSDKQNRFSYIRILESTAARAVLHFRYGQCEVENATCANPDPLTGWTDVADDYYTIYPDGVAVRKAVAWTSNFKTWHEFQESIVINAPGTRPEDNIQTGALTIGNMKGETETYSWEHPPVTLSRPANANIQMVNLKSDWKPFQIVFPENAKLSTYLGEKTYSMFEWWNHWPTAAVKSSGISAVAADRASHSSLSHIEGEPYAETENSITKIMMAGLTNKPAAELAVLAKSWITPPAMIVAGGAFSGKGYDPTQRSFVVDRSGSTLSTLHIDLDATENSPLDNPAFVVEGWGDAVPELKIDGKPAAWGIDFRYGKVNELDRSQLVVWLRLMATTKTTIEIAPSEK